MQRTRHQLFAAARLTSYQHGNWEIGNLSDARPQLPRRIALAHKAEFRLRVGRRPAEQMGNQHHPPRRRETDPFLELGKGQLALVPEGLTADADGALAVPAANAQPTVSRRADQQRLAADEAVLEGGTARASCGVEARGQPGQFALGNVGDEHAITDS